MILNNLFINTYVPSLNNLYMTYTGLGAEDYGDEEDSD